MGSEVCTESWLQKLLKSAHLVFIGIDGDVVKWRDVFARRVFCGKSVIHLFSTNMNLTVRWHSHKGHYTWENQWLLHWALWKWCSYWKRPGALQCVAFPSPLWWNSCLVLVSDSSSVFCASTEEAPDSPSDRGIRHAQCLSWGLHLAAPCRWHERPPSEEPAASPAFPLANKPQHAAGEAWRRLAEISNLQSKWLCDASPQLLCEFPTLGVWSDLFFHLWPCCKLWLFRALCRQKQMELTGISCKPINKAGLGGLPMLWLTCWISL